MGSSWVNCTEMVKKRWISPGIKLLLRSFQNHFPTSVFSWWERDSRLVWTIVLWKHSYVAECTDLVYKKDLSMSRKEALSLYYGSSLCGKRPMEHRNGQFQVFWLTRTGSQKRCNFFAKTKKHIYQALLMGSWNLQEKICKGLRTLRKLPQKCQKIFGCLSRFDGFKAGLGLVQTNVRIQWNPVYKAFHRIRLCGNEQSVS